MGMYTEPAMVEATIVMTVSSECPAKELVAYAFKL
jgi:hypothetical protein